MPGPRQGNRRADRDTFGPSKDTKSKPKTKPTKQPLQKADRKPLSAPTPTNTDPESPVDFSAQVPVSLQQLTLDVFKTALLTSSTEPLDIKSLIQTIKSHLYQRDFDAAFTDANGDLLRAYALRWSASRALGYVGLFKGLLQWMRDGEENVNAKKTNGTRAVCLGGGAGAEIVALAAAWRDLGLDIDIDGLNKAAAGISLVEKSPEEQTPAEPNSVETTQSKEKLSIAAVDIADWSSIVDLLSKTITSPDVPCAATSRYKSPLLSKAQDLDISFRREDLLSLPEQDLRDLVLGTSTTQSLLVTLMFTLNELFSTSMPKATGFLLRLTEILAPGAVLLVVDSPGSYSSVKLGKEKDGEAQERKYPMKFLLDHALMSVAGGKWERVHTQDSKWWRREASRLMYEVGEGAGLEDMRFQIHLYQRV